MWILYVDIHPPVSFIQEALFIFKSIFTNQENGIVLSG